MHAVSAPIGESLCAGVRRGMSPRVGRQVIAASLVLAGVSIACAQLSRADIAALRQRGQAEGWTFSVGENAATRRPMEQLCGLVEPADWASEVEWLPQPTRTDALPESFDWRNPPAGYPVGVVPIRDQGACGSCWAFGAVGALECSIMAELGVEVDLSEQWLVSCTGAGSCAGGWHDDALMYMQCRGVGDVCGDYGAVLEADFPYVAADVACGCPFAHPFCFYRFDAIANGEASIKHAIMNHGPVTTTVFVDGPFSAYTGGVFNACANTMTVNHAVVLVGWDDADQCWIMRNSWGPNWGEDGYMRIQYGCSRIGYATFAVRYEGPDCNSNGVIDDFDLDDGTSEDCNGNNRPDECDIADGTALDCNTNGVPDACDILAGHSGDCNANGVPDACDVLVDASVDCNTNGLPDECDLAAVYRAHSTMLRPLGGDAVLEFPLDDPRVAEEDVPLVITARGDLNYNSEHIDVLLDGDYIGSVFDGPASDCSEVVATISIAAATFNAALADGSVTITLDPTAGVNPLICDDSFATIEIEYVGEPRAQDCNTNGVPDTCDIRNGTSTDLNKDGVPDECPGLDIGDCNCDGEISWRDVDYFVAGMGDDEAGWRAMFAPAEPSCAFANLDVTGDGSVNWRDIGPFVTVMHNAVGK